MLYKIQFFWSNFYKKLKIGKFNSIEKIYVTLFILSIFSGIIYGILNPNYYNPSEEAGNLDVQEGENNVTIFYSNFLLSIVSLVTAGISNFYYNFITFSVVTSFFYTSGTLIAIFFMLFTFGIVELLGAMLIGLVGLNFAERFFGRIFKSRLKVKSKLNVKRLFIFGMILLFFASLIEYGLFLFL